MSLSPWLTGLLLISLTGAHGLSHFPENFVIAKRNDNGPVTLTCREASEGTVVWKLNDEDVDFEDLDHYKSDGKNLIVSEIDAPLLGEYSCWTGEEKLSSTFLLQEAEEQKAGDQNDKEQKDSFLSCRAKSYDCDFTCSWNNSHYTAVRLGVGQECATHQESCHWVSSSDVRSEGSQFVLSHTLSPYAEESTKLEVTAEATNSNFYFLSENKKFYLRDIVVPDSPHIVRCQEVDQELNVTIDPPSSWSTPHSFFSLEHEIEYVFRDDGSKRRSLSTLIPRGISKLRVRSRDSVVLSPWSQWTPWKNVTH
ncbi:interleukin-12 subunit beta [Austrofundulus limnaeus]|uniref:Interleukin-12 subunit beta n=1 Tax=Austrofundulus limnaeus TaxID=52670 RepID=A0A2I4BHG9_AUSLI|nr:PREDICTED: interleukin-12 subunit beta-like [Austrofundulus limnaeus]